MKRSFLLMRALDQWKLLSLFWVALGVFLLTAPLPVWAHDFSVSTSFTCMGGGCAQLYEHEEADPFKGWGNFEVQNTGTEPWGYFHFEIFQVTAEPVDSVFFDVNTPYEPTSSQSGLTWSVSGGGNTLDLHFYSNPVLPGEIATFSVYKDNASDQVSFFGISYYPTPACTDDDADGYYLEGGCPEPLDCDDTNENIYPTNSNANCNCDDPIPQGTTEVCSGGIDEDCDGLIDSDDPECWVCTDQGECNDTNECTDDDCVGHQCQYSAVNCDDGNECTDDSCDSVSGCLNSCNATGTEDPCCDDPACSSEPTCQGGYSQTANTMAASYGRTSLTGSGVFNTLALLLVPVGAVIAIRIWRKKR